MHLQNFIKIHQLVHKILSINKILTSIKGHENERKILFNHTNLHLVNINTYTKFDINPQINSKDNQYIYKILSPFIHLFWRYWGKTNFNIIQGPQLLFINKFCPFASPNYSSLISISMQSLKKFGQKLLKLRVRKQSADGRTDGPTGRYSNGWEGIT